MNPTRKLAPLALLLLASGAAQALDWTGYFRAGPGLTSNNANRACYGLNGGSSGMKYRLGNECDLYGEFQLDQAFKKDGLEYKVSLMTNHYTGNTDTDGKGLAIEQLWAEVKGIDLAPEATFWVGKERGRRGDVHITDTQIVEMKGVGFGVKNLGGRFGVAYYKNDDQPQKPGHRINFEWLNLPANQDAALNVFATLTKGDFQGGTTGAGLSLRHDQKKLFGTGLSNTLWLQYAQGSAAVNSNFGDLTAGSQAKGWRLVNALNGQSGAVGGQLHLLLAKESDKSGKDTTSASLGGRVSVGMSRNLKFLTELGVSQYKPEGGSTARLSKLTVGPALSIDNSFWSRPELRLYVTHARWNKAAGNVTGNAAFANKTSGTSAGAQVEWWF
ncbi:carbohydrate porin [Inhella sp.]|uniref:carbohydrate porin n=1 Tax=Inhella sp. TaxID=1921806 RepID=UPI0035ADDA9F